MALSGECEVVPQQDDFIAEVAHDASVADHRRLKTPKEVGTLSAVRVSSASPCGNSALVCEQSVFMRHPQADEGLGATGRGVDADVEADPHGVRSLSQ